MTEFWSSFWSSPFDPFAAVVGAVSAIFFWVLLCPARRASLGDGSASRGARGLGAGPPELLMALGLLERPRFDRYGAPW